MNAVDVLKYGHLWVLKHVNGLSDAEWETPGVCGVWSVREIIAHLASFECVLGEILESFSSPSQTPNLDQYRQKDGDTFNAIQVGMRKNMSPREVLAEYTGAQDRVMASVSKMPSETLRRAGTLPWYGMEYDLEDFIVYTFYGHKREHCAQIAAFRDQLKK